MPKITHEGVSLHRLSQNPAEAIFAREWRKVNKPERWLNSGIGTLDLLLCFRGDTTTRLRELTQEEEATAAATVIQWLGSPVGYEWLRNTMKKVEAVRNAQH